MFGQNPVLKKRKYDGNYQIVKGSPFRTIQGEGPYAGRPAMFLRLHGCNLRCTFCDTQFSDPNDPQLSMAILVNMMKHSLGLTVITGGEPMLQDIVKLCEWLKKEDPGNIIQIETAGTIWREGIQDVAELVVSPKTPMIDAQVRQNAVAFKYIVSATQQWNHKTGVPIATTQPGGAKPRPLATPRRGAPVYLSPMDEYDEVKNQANRARVAELAVHHGYYAGLQMHKFFGVE